MRRRLYVLLLCSIPGCGGGSSSPPVAGNIVTNGDFEEPAVYSVSTFRSPTTVGGWTIESGTVDWNNYPFAATGTQFVDMNGWGPGAISQQLTTIPGHAYTIRFSCCGNWGAPPTVKTMEVYWGTTRLDTIQSDITGHGDTNPGWVDKTYTVTGTGHDLIRFVSTTPNSAGGTYVDNVQVIQ